MNVVMDVSQLKENIDTLENYLSGKTDPTYNYAVNLVKKGTCFIASIQKNGEYHFYPSRFIGYVGNTMDKHMNNVYKDGKETNPAISKIVGCKPREDKELDAKYQAYCETLGFTAREKGSFGVARKYWILQV